LSQIKQVIIAELILDEDTEYISGERVRRFSGSPPVQTVVYSGTVMSWGSIEKSIPCPSGMPHIGNATIRISDHWQHWRSLLATQVLRRRVMRITQLPAGASVADYDPRYVGEVINVVTYSQGYIEIELRDRLFSWVDELIPAMAIRELYPDVIPDDEGGFIPIVVGEMVTEDDSSPSTGSPQGLVPIPHIGIVQAGSPPVNVDRWVAGMTPLLEVIPYRRQTVSIDEDVTTPEWVPVDTSEYDIREVEFTAEENPFGAFTMTHTVVDFVEQQPDGTELRAEIRGIYTRGAWGSLAAIDGSTFSPQITLRNPIDAFINISFLLMRQAGLTTSMFDTVEIGDLRALFDTLGFYADFAITEEISGREWLGQFLASYSLDMVPNREGKITLKYTRDPSDDSPVVIFPPVFKEGKHILKNTFVERLPETVVTQLVLLWRYNNALGKYERRLVIDTAEQEALHTVDEDSPSTTIQKIEKAELALPCVRDDDTAIEIAGRHLAFLSLGSFRQEFQMPSVPTFDDLVIGDLAKITHTQGCEEGGYDERQIKILGVTEDLDKQTVYVRSILWPPLPIFTEAAAGAGSGRPTIAFEFEDPTQVNPARSRIENGTLAIDADLGLGLSLTFADLQIDSTRSTTPNYAQLHLYGFPSPAPPVGLSLATITVKAVVQYVLPSAAGGQPSSTVNILNVYTTDLLGVPATYHQSIFTNAGAVVPGIAKATYSKSITLAEWATFFNSSASNLFVRCMQEHSLNQDFPITIHEYVYDCWIEYTYA